MHFAQPNSHQRLCTRRAERGSASSGGSSLFLRRNARESENFLPPCSSSVLRDGSGLTAGDERGRRRAARHRGREEAQERWSAARRGRAPRQSVVAARRGSASWQRVAAERRDSAVQSEVRRAVSTFLTGARRSASRTATTSAEPTVRATTAQGRRTACVGRRRPSPGCLRADERRGELHSVRSSGRMSISSVSPRILA